MKRNTFRHTNYAFLLKKKLYILILYYLLCPGHVNAQKIAVVLSGGGSDGLTHIGVLKALEENDIPIDYIAGTSIGALVGGLYASGYSPDEIELMARSATFRNWAQGKIENKYIYYSRQKEPDASWINFKFNADTMLQSSLPTNLISPVPLDFGLIELFSPASALANCNFDSLFVPFFCVASNITQKRAEIFTGGDLGQCIRASMSYPFYLKALNLDNNLYVDGGLYNNFPVDIAYKEFKPDIIIGATVSENVKPPDEDDLLSQVKSLMINRKQEYDLAVETIIIQPTIGQASLFDFEHAEDLINNGYQITMLKMDEIKKRVKVSTGHQQTAEKRKQFRSKQPKLDFNYIHLSGLSKSQSRYVKRLLGLNRNKIQHLEDIKPPYFRLASDPKIAQIYPTAQYEARDKLFQLSLKIKKEKNIFASFGGNFSSRPINEAYISLQYNYLGNIGATFFANSYFGKFYGSYMVKVRLDFPSRVPYFLETGFTRNRWDYFRSSTAFFEESKPSYYIQNENYADLALGLPASKKAKILVGVSSANHFDRYYQTKSFFENDTTDRTDFLNLSPFLKFERSTLNKKQFANSGSLFSMRYRYVFGNEITDPGTTSGQQIFTTGYHEWYQFWLHYSDFFKDNGIWRMGYTFEMLMSNQPFFANYTASKLSCLQFNPIPEAKTFFMDQFRVHSYLSFGLKSIVQVFPNFDLRMEGYIFQPYQEIKQADTKAAFYGRPFSKRYLIGSTTLVYHSPLGPLGINVNYYQASEKPLSILFSFGYLLFNRRNLE